MLKSNALLFINSLLVLLLLQSCSGNGFHLRENVDLPLKYQRIQIENLSYENDFVKAFEVALEESGGQLLEQDSSPITKIKINNFREGKRIVAYTKERKAREYLLFLKFDYTIKPTKKLNANSSVHFRINLDRVFIYDPDFALGKAEEEDKIRDDLYAEAARLMLLRLQYSK